jgi:hypothetical protein
MKIKPGLRRKKTPPDALKAAFARLTGTPAYVIRDGRIVDAARPTRKRRKLHGPT